MPDPHKEAGLRLANILVIAALLAMLVGAVVLIMARDETPLRIAPGEEVVVLEHTSRSWDPFGADLRVRIFGPANVTLSAAELSGTGQEETETASIEPRFILVWEEHAAPEETWRVTARNDGDAVIAAAATVIAVGNHWVGGVFVASGLAGFVFHRLGMRRSG